ncbi:hypothetical protein Tdes44962_MAKER05715 [Teratosphaeria destructans]|uniref:Uncharacterized protein n=1 Tax=Teratosphaeria destructans TaxID=418781 RepID=A0A9W7VYR3_9PEZI|nr:hypothetical protein Tdes44962_MAKER05715 [Teratosphaeria destructans]
MANVQGCHMVGSVPFANTEAVLRQCPAALPHRLKRIPDGETGPRNYFTLGQMAVFRASPMVLTQFVDNKPLAANDDTPEEIEAGLKRLQDAGPLETGYDVAAIESYAVFKALKDEGVLDRGTRFQVCLPTPPNALSPLVQKSFQAKLEPMYTDALYRAMENIQRQIPHGELAIQIDLAVDTAYWERTLYEPWFGGGDFEAIKNYIVEYIVRMIGQIDQDVEVGIHNCYGESAKPLSTPRSSEVLTRFVGDMANRHWLEPRDLGVIVDRALRIYARTPHKINYFHLPVAKSAMENLDAYFAPLAELLPSLREHATELYLGVVHHSDMAATTTRMIEAAGKVLDGYPFGLATECGWGRTPREKIEEIMEISREMSRPVV